MFIIPVYNAILLPGVKYHLPLGNFGQEVIEHLSGEENVILLPVKEHKSTEDLLPQDFFNIGVISEINEIRSEKETVISVLSKDRVEVYDLHLDENGIQGSFSIKESVQDVSEEEEKEMLAVIKNNTKEILADYPWGIWMMSYIKKWSSVNEAAAALGSYLDLEVDKKYEILETNSLKERYERVITAVKELKADLNLQVELGKKEDETQKKAMKEMAIRKQINVLQKELDEMDPNGAEGKAFQEKIEKAEMPADVKKEVLRVFKRFEQENPNGHEYGSLYDYLDFVTSLQWKPEKGKKINLSKAREVLSAEHYGMEKVKERILQQMAVMALNKKQNGSILLFVGAPGTGKTSMGKSIAKALEREYVRVSLGGVRDEAEIRGHRRTYIGAMPGRIMDGIKRSGVMNPVMVLDEIDKLGISHNGDPASALLEVLDPEQNWSFTDHYMNVPYDLSKALFVCTANTTDSIPRPLLDRMEVIQISGYSPTDKFHIAKEHLLAKSIESSGLKKKNLVLSDDVIRKIIEEYTMEAGVRGLKKQLDKIGRFAAVKKVEDKKKQIEIKEEDLQSVLGKKVSRHEKILKDNKPGVVTGLAWTPVGGEILFIETTAMNGSGQLHITGQLGDVMKESASISASLVKSMFFDEKLDFKDKDIHIHVPSGAVPKDGPSAGITLFTAITSLVTGVPVNPKVAMTGEISLRGQVMPIGGLPEKLLAAERAGIKKVLIPWDNKEDLVEVPEEIKEKLEIVPVNTIEEVVLHAMNIKLIEKPKTFFYKNPRDCKMGVPLITEKKEQESVLVGQ